MPSCDQLSFEVNQINKVYGAGVEFLRFSPVVVVEPILPTVVFALPPQLNFLPFNRPPVCVDYSPSEWHCPTFQTEI